MMQASHIPIRLNEKSCVRCGDFFVRPTKISVTQWEARQYCSKKCSATKSTVRDEDVLSLHKKNLLNIDVAKALNITERQVQVVLVRHGMVRSRSATIKISHSRSWVREKISKAATGIPCRPETIALLKSITGPKHPLWLGGITTSAQGYLVYTNSKYNEDRAGKSLHTCIAEKFLGYERGYGLHVHHLDNNKKNNDPSNLVVLTASAHARLHALENGLGKHGSK